MGLKINATDIRWWFWAVTLAFIIVALAGWVPGYYVVIGISAVQVLFFLVQEKSLITFPSIQTLGRAQNLQLNPWFSQSFSRLLRKAVKSANSWEGLAQT